MGIRLDQLHDEVFEKINKNLNESRTDFIDYIDKKIAELDIVFGLPETTQVEKDGDLNKRNLEKSGFIELNRSFVPFRAADQADTGVWISNLDTNESPFEAQTIDGQKRGINVAGFNINYTKGNIGQDIHKMTKLPIAPNLPVFFPEDNDMRFGFNPKKTVINQKTITDQAIDISITRRITDDFKIDIDKLIDGDRTKYYYMDEDSNVFYLTDEGRSYLETSVKEDGTIDPKDLLLEPYKRYSKAFGKNFIFEKIYNSDGVGQYIDSSDGKIFNIVKASSTDATKIKLKTDDDKAVHLEEMTVKRFVEENGELVEKEITQNMLVKFVITEKTINGLTTDVLTKEIVSPSGFDIMTEIIDSTEYKYIEDNDIQMYLEPSKLYFYYPFSKYQVDENNNPVYEDDNTTQKTEIDTSYVKYILYDNIEDKENMQINVIDNISGKSVTRDIHETNTTNINYYRVNALMVKDSNDTVSTLDEFGNYTTEVSTSRPIKINDDNQLVTTNTLGDLIVLSAGKEFYYYHEVGTKYYKDLHNNIYFLDRLGNIYKPDNDVQEIFEGVVTNTDTEQFENKLFYVANGLLFYIDNEQLRTYIENEEKQKIQLTDVNGYRIFQKSDGTKVYVYITSENKLKKVTIDNQGVEHEIDISYKDITPIFETEEVLEDVLNLNISIPFNIIQGNIKLTRNGQKLSMYSDYEIDGKLILKKPLEFNEETKKGDTLYVKRVGKKDIILRLEKAGAPNTDENPNADIEGDWENDTGTIVMPEPLTGNSFNWTDGEELQPNEELGYNDIVKKDNKFYKYTGTAISYDDMPADNKKITVQENGVFWEDVTVQELEWERKGQNFKVISADKGDIIRFTIIRRVWQQNELTGELEVIEQEPYIIEKKAAQSGENLFILDDPHFNLDNDATLESYILIVENIKIYGKYEHNRANNFKLTLTGLQTVAVNTDTAMIYGEGYYLAENVLKLKDANINDDMLLVRIQAPQSELKIEFESETEQPKIEVPFDIIKNKFDIVIPKKLYGHEYTWIMGEELPEGKKLSHGDVVFDKENIKFYKYIGPTASKHKRSLLRQSDDVQKELLRQFFKIQPDLRENKDYFSFFNVEWAKKAKELSDEAGATINYFKNVDGEDVLNISDSKAQKYLRLAKDNMIKELTHELNDSVVDAMDTTDILTESVKNEIKEILSTDLKQNVLKLVKYGSDNKPILDEDGNIVYYYKYTRNFMVEKNQEGQFISRNIFGAETVINNIWEDITGENVGYYRFGKTFTILDTKAKDQIVVRLLESGADEFTSKRVTATGGEFTFSIDFNIEKDNGDEIPFEVIYEEINWIEGIDYIQEGQVLTLTMVDKPNQKVIIRRNDEFDLIDIVVLERKDLVFVEVWHEDVSETGYIFPYGNVQYQGTECDNIMTTPFDHVFYDTINGETAIIPDGNKKYCRAYDKGSIVYNYYAGTEFVPVTDEEKKIIDDTFEDDSTLGRGWKVSELTDDELQTIFKNHDHNLYYDGNKLIQIRYRTRIVALNLFKNFFKGTSDYMSEGLRFQGSSPVTSRIVTQEIGEYTSTDGDGSKAGQPILETIQVFAGGKLIQASNPNSLLYKEGKLYDDALFTVEEKTDLSANGFVYAIPIAIINRRNQGVYHPTFNANGTSFFINGMRVSEDKEDFSDDITGFTLVDENSATLETSSVGRDRKAKFKVMLKWLFSSDYKAGGSMVSRTTYRPDGLLYDEINTKDIIDLRIDANDQRKRIEDLEADVTKGFKNLNELSNTTNIRFSQTNNYIKTTANLIYSHISKTEKSIRKDMTEKDNELAAMQEITNTNLADLSANVFTKNITTSLLIDSIVGLTDYNKSSAFNSNHKPTRSEISEMIHSFVENMEGPYTKIEFMKLLVTALKSVVDKNMLTEEALDRWIRRLSVKDLSVDAESSIYSRAESLELIYEGLILTSSSRILPPLGSEKLENWTFKGKRFNGWLGSKILDLKRDFLENGRTPVAEKEIKVTDFTKTYTDRFGKVWNKGYIAGPTVWGNVHNYHAIYTAWIFVEEPFKLDHVKMNGDDPHAIFINGERVAFNKYCCRDTAYSYDFSVSGWYRIDAVYSERYGGHYVQLGWNPKDYQDNIKYMTTKNMDEAVRLTKMRLDNWASKLKTLTSTIKGDATGYFTKLEAKLILIEGLKRIRNNILTYGTNITPNEILNFNKSLEKWIDNENGDGKFSALGHTVQDGMDENNQPYARVDEFRPVPDLNGYYNKDEIVEIVRRSLELSNGIDSIDSEDIQKWVDRLDISISMENGVRYYTINQTQRLIADGINYLSGLDKVTSYEISGWLDNHISNYRLDAGGTDVDRIFTDANGQDLSVTETGSNVYNKQDFKVLLATEIKKILGAQSAKN